MTRPCLAVALWLAFACASPTAPVPSAPVDSPLRVTAQGAAVQLENVSERRVFYLAYARGAASLINWSACVEPACPSVTPGARAVLPYSAIGGYAPGKSEALVWWWEAVPGPAGKPVPGAIHALVVGL